MELNLMPSSKMSEVNSCFVSDFPNLRLVFFQTTDFVKWEPLDRDVYLSQLRLFNGGVFYYTSETHITDFEDLLLHYHGLRVRVQVNVNSIWADANTIGNLTLEAQDALGKIRRANYDWNPATLYL